MAEEKKIKKPRGIAKLIEGKCLSRESASHAGHVVKALVTKLTPSK